MDPKWLLDAIRQFNRRSLNPLMLSFAGHRGRLYSVARHKGRRSGKEYRTPVVATFTRDEFITRLYGAQTDWLRNVRAAGRFTLEQKGVAHEVGELEVTDKEAAEGAFPRWLRGRLRHTEHFLKVKRLSETELEQAAQSGALLR